jgi:replication factor C subunit 3/5
MYTYDDFLKKHAPQRFADMTFADDIVGQQTAEYAQRINYDNILLYGPIGSAKSTAARVIAEERQRALGITDLMVEAHEARDLRGHLNKIENSINLLLSFRHEDAQPYVIIEEVDQLTQGEQEQLRTEINTLPVGKLILTTNYINKLDPALVSRCDAVEVLLPSPQQMLHRAHAMLAADGVSDTDTNLLNIMHTSALVGNVPSMRDIMRALHKRVLILQRQQQAMPKQLRSVPAFTVVAGKGAAANKKHKSP